jgi:hypothetical protein
MAQGAKIEGNSSALTGCVRTTDEQHRETERGEVPLETAYGVLPATLTLTR